MLNTAMLAKVLLAAAAHRVNMHIVMKFLMVNQMVNGYMYIHLIDDTKLSRLFQVIH